jgi:hypothetical protein
MQLRHVIAKTDASNNRGQDNHIEQEDCLGAGVTTRAAKLLDNCSAYVDAGRCFSLGRFSLKVSDRLRRASMLDRDQDFPLRGNGYGTITNLRLLSYEERCPEIQQIILLVVSVPQISVSDVHHKQSHAL